MFVALSDDMDCQGVGCIYRFMPLQLSLRFGSGRVGRMSEGS